MVDVLHPVEVGGIDPSLAQERWFWFAVEVFDEQWGRRRILRNGRKEVKLWSDLNKAYFDVHCNPKYGKRWTGYRLLVVVERSFRLQWQDWCARKPLAEGGSEAEEVDLCGSRLSVARQRARDFYSRQEAYRRSKGRRGDQATRRNGAPSTQASRHLEAVPG